MIQKLLAGLVLCLIGVAGVLAADNENPFLEDLQHRSFQYFWDEANPATGLIPDRAGADGQKHYPICSIASVGFGLTGICIADHHHWITHEAAYDRVVTTLRFLHDQFAERARLFLSFPSICGPARAAGARKSRRSTPLS